MGTGAGGLAGQRGTVLRLLTARLQEVTAELDVDVALVLDEPRDSAAAQVLREDGGRDLPPALLARADELGRRAAGNGLSVFIGAGASVPLGLPDGDELVRLLCAEAGSAPEEGEAPAVAASRAVAALPPGRLDDLVRRLFDVEQHTLAHGLLASLRVRLDPRYGALVGAGPDLELRERVAVLLGEVERVRGGLGWPVLVEALERLGADPLEPGRAS